jgi:hypothetical protein
VHIHSVTFTTATMLRVGARICARAAFAPAPVTCGARTMATQAASSSGARAAWAAGAAGIGAAAAWAFYETKRAEVGATPRSCNPTPSPLPLPLPLPLLILPFCSRNCTWTCIDFAMRAAWASPAHPPVHAHTLVLRLIIFQSLSNASSLSTSPPR